MTESLSGGAMAPLQRSRRHRFMEASDFTAAARWAHEVFARATAAGKGVAPVFIGFHMDPVTPGLTLAAKSTPAISTDDGFVRSAFADMHSDGRLDYGLVAFAAPVDGTEQDAAGVHWPRRGIRLAVASVDRTVSTMFDLVPSRSKSRELRLRYSALGFVAS